MRSRNLISKSLFIASSLLLGTACGPVIEETYEIVPEQLDETWVFSYSEAPRSNMEALLIGEATVEDGCLLVDGLAVIWHPSHLDLVEDTLERVEAGESPVLRLGGGAPSTLPSEVTDHCAVQEVWYSGPDMPTFEE